jgi:2-polyprenyl-6-methoxyphenol hydroxylase-like FAD-dependent oxidoreductase
MLLARDGHEVVLLDRAHFPSDTISTHWIVRPGIELLEGWGLLDRVVATGCPPIDRVRVSFGTTVIDGMPSTRGGEPATTYAPRRTVLDEILLDAAIAAGVRVHTGIGIRDVLTEEDGRVTGVTGQDETGASVEFEADLVIGADGRNSTVARAVGAGFVADRGALAATLYGYWAGLPADGAEVRVGEGLGSSRWPTNDGLVVLALTVPRQALLGSRAGVAEVYRQVLASMPELASELAGAELSGRVHGAANLRNFYRQSHGPGWVLVGDAAHHKDPIGSRGISDAFADAEGVVRAYTSARSGRVPLERALERHRALRAAATAATFDFICRQAALTPVDEETMRLMRAVAADPAATGQLVSVFAGSARIEDFFAPANLDRILAGAAATSR